MPELVAETSFLTLAGLLAMVAVTRRRSSRWPVYPLAAAISVLGAIAAAGRFTVVNDPPLDAALLSVALLASGVVLRHLQWPARLFLSSLVITSVAYLAVLFAVTFSGSLPAFGFVLSLCLLLLEVLGFALTIAFAFEMAEALGRARHDPGASSDNGDYQPRVCLQVPAYNEPPELVIATLEALAALDYPNFVVQAVVNNTVNPDLWKPIEETCRLLGARFHFVYLPKCDGFKSGALNRATELLGEDVDLVAIVDADYLVRPEFLAECVPHFADPAVAFLQTPQHYREWKDSAYLRGLFYAYRYFFDVTMVARARTNAIIFGGTMGLIRLSVLRSIGGWAEWCITEDAEASLRILAQGWRGLYLHKPYGEGLMPLDFDGLRRQRFRWAFGGVQILRRHIWLLVGLTRSRLTFPQRYHYLVGGLGWFGDLVGAALGLFLLVTAPLLALGRPILLRQLSGVVLALPLFLLVTGIFRLGWALKVSTGARWRDVPAAVMVMLALGWTVAQACFLGTFAERGVFLRTPKFRSPSRLGRAVRSTMLESAIAGIFVLLAVGLLLRPPAPLLTLVAVLAVWQAASWGSAPAAALLSQDIQLTPLRALLRRSPQNTGERPWTRRAARIALAPLLAIALVVLLAPAVATGAGDNSRLAHDLGLPPPAPLPGVDAVAAAISTPHPSPSAAGQTAMSASKAGTPSGATPAPAAIPTPTAAPTAQPTSSPTGRPTAAPTPVSVPSASPTYPASRPTARPTPR